MKMDNVEYSVSVVDVGQFAADEAVSYAQNIPVRYAPVDSSSHHGPGWRFLSSKTLKMRTAT